MISFFVSLKVTSPMREIEVEELHNLIKNGYTMEICDRIREMVANGQDYSHLKQTLPATTPNVSVFVRNLKDKSNLKAFSGYMYFDFDNIEGNVKVFKKDFIQKYQGLVTLVTLSASGKGIGVLVKLNRQVNSIEQFNSYRRWLEDNVFFDEVYLDKKVKDVGRLWFISYDPEVYFDDSACANLPLDDAFFTIDESVLSKHITKTKKNKLTDQIDDDKGTPLKSVLSKGRKKTPIINLPYHFAQYTSPPDFSEFQSIVLESQLAVQDPLFEYRPVDYVRVWIPPKINDGTKHRFYFYLFLSLLYLNPDKPELVFWYVYQINKDRTEEHPMRFSRLVDIFQSCLEYTKQNDYSFNGVRTKRFHFNPEAKVPKEEKIRAANKVSNTNIACKTCLKVKDCIKEMTELGEKLSDRKGAKFCNVAVSTLRKYRNTNCPDIGKTIEQVKNRLKSLLDNTFSNDMGLA